ncbi:MAG: flippase activity-associated protein Agl23 [Dehalococcoidia bacterium]|jgi:predicted membrane-bound mannosyltransferase/DNA-binding beta-propeller fold protein YncE
MAVSDEPVSDEPKKPPFSVTASSAQALAWLKANWPRYWEIAVFAAIVAVAAGLRLWHLGLRAISHDESLHATYSWYLYNGQGYTHDPMMHGPFKFFGVAFIWKVLAFVSAAPFLSNWVHWGPSDYTARLLPAIFGTALVALPFFFRSYIGRVGAFFAALLLAFSPILLFFSRYIRDDVLIAFFTLALVICMWRYLSEHRTWFLFLIAGLLALSFVTMEAAFLISGLLLLYLEMLVAWEMHLSIREHMETAGAPIAPPPDDKSAKSRRQRRVESQPVVAARREASPFRWAALFIVLIPFAWLIAAAWPFISKWRARWGLEKLPLSADLLLVMGTLAGVQFAAGVQLIPFIGGTKTYYKDPGVNEETIMKLSVFSFLFVTAYIGLLWKPRTWLICAGIFYAIFVLFYTSFFTNMGGFWSGIWGSLDYWLQQQGVQRGSQPVYYPLMVLTMYEFLPLAVATIGGLWLLMHRRFLASLAAVLAGFLIVFAYFTLHASLPGMVPVLVVLGIILFLLRQDLFTSFLIFWSAGSLIEIMTAGEKMPQHSIYVVVPLAILAAKFMDTFFERFRIRLPFDWRSDEALVVWAGVCGFLAVVILWLTAFSAAGAVLALLLGVAAAGLIIRATTLRGALLGGQAAVALLVPALFIFTVRDTFRASFQIGTWPREILSYADISPTLPYVRDQAVALGQQSGLGNNYPVVIDNEIAWPMVWYFHNFTKVTWASSSMTPPVAGSVVLIGMDHQSWMDPYLDDYQQPIPVRHLWWFGDGPQYYDGITSGGFVKDLFDPSVWNVWRNYFVWRQTPWAPPPDDSLLYLPKPDQIASSTSKPVPAVTIPTVTVPPASQVVIGSQGSGSGQFNEPTDVSVDQVGNVYVADGKNNRIEVFDKDGKVLRVFQPTGDAALNEPWSVAVAPDGSIYVSDTWNKNVGGGIGQVIKYDADFNLVWKSDPTIALYGPRDLLVLPDGNVLVADTGNKRIVDLKAADGTLAGAFGTSGSDQGQFNEPVGLALGPNGNIYVADTWNGRVQVFDSSFKYVTQFTVKGWGSQEVTAKPYLVVLPDGRVILSNPANGRIELYAGFGAATASWTLPSVEGVAGRPVGMALDRNGSLYVADCNGNVVYRLPVSSLTGP